MSDVLSRLEALTPERRARLLDRLKQERRADALNPLTRVDRHNDLPLSYAQRRLWFLERLEGRSAAYNMPAAFRLRGTLDAAAVAAALREILRRHEVLRTRLVERNGEPVQAIDDPAVESAGARLRTIDLSAGPQADPEGRLRALLQDEARHPFDLSTEYPFRSLLVRVAPDEHVLCVNLHHVASDGWSTGVLIREFSALYNAFRAGQPSPLPELPVQYADFGAWQRRGIEADEAATAAQLAYWRDRLAGAPGVVNLPSDFPRGARPDTQGDSVYFRIDAGVADAVNALALSEGASAYMVMLAVFFVLLHRWSGDGDMTIGSPIANRPRKELEGLIGFFVNTLALRIRVDDDPDFRALLHRVRGVALEAYAHADLPFEQLVEKLNPERRLNQSPFFQLMLAMQSGTVDEGALHGLRIEPVPVATGAARLDMLMSLQETGDGIAGCLEFSTALFRADTAQRFAEHFRNLLASAVQQPDTPVSRLDLLNRGERHRVLVEWNRTDAPFNRAMCLHQLVEEQARKTPDAIAVRFRDMSWSYATLMERAGDVSALLQDKGVGAVPDTLVGVCIERSPEMIAALLGVLRAGGAYVALDPAYPAARLQYVLTDSRALIVLTSSALAADIRAVPGTFDIVALDGVPPGSAADRRPPAAVTPSHLAYVLYTSGSTGRPKGVAIEHRSPVALIQWARSVWSLDELSGVLAGTSICFDLSVFEIFLPLSVGGTVILADTVLDLPALECRDLVTLINTVPSAIDALLGQDGLPSSVRVVNLAGEPLTTELADRVYDVPSVTKVYDLYGPSEDTTYSTFALRRRGDAATIGRPIANTRLYILDKSMQPMPAGLPGEIYLAGEGLARGYLGQPELTSERFVPSPFAGGDRLYRTGDIGRFRPDGHVEYLGRVDHQVKLRGFRIELGEIESVLREFPGVGSCVVIVQEASAGNKRLAAYVAHAAGQTIADALHEHVRRRLPDYMVPPVLVVLERLPLTPNGKIDRQALPSPNTRNAAAALQTLNPLEQRLAGVWEGLLNTGRIGASDDFFVRGGHSLLAARLASKIRDVFNVEIPLRALFEHPTLRAQAAAIAALQAASSREPTPIPIFERRDRLPLAFAQERLWFLDQLEPGSTAYNMAGAIRLTGDVDAAALGRAFDRIVDRHEVLRTIFPTIEGRACAAPGAVRPAMTHLDLRPIGLADPVHDLLRAEAQQPFDLASGPLVRAAAIRVADRETILAVTMHHIVSDGWSVDLFVNELAAFYTVETGGAAPAPAPLPLQYADFAAWQRRRFDSGEMSSQVTYWQETLAGIPTVIDLPTDRPRPESQSYLGAACTTVIDAPLAALLARRNREFGVTPFMTLLAIFGVVLHRCSGQDDVVVGFPAAGRSRSELEPLIGMFVNTIPIRLTTAGDSTFAQTLAQVRTRTLDALANQDVPFEKLVEALGVERSLAWSPLFQVMFVMQSAQAPVTLPAGISAEPIPAPAQESTKFDLTLAIADHGNQLSVSLEYDRALFDRRTIEGLSSDFLHVLRAVLDAPSGRLDSIDRPAGAAARPRALDAVAPSPASPSSAPASHDRAAGPVEEALQDIWRQVLALDDVRVTENFFELGGDSIVSIRVIAKLRERGWRLQPRDIFRHQTIRALAAVAQPIETASEPAGEDTGDLPLTPMQQLFFALNPPTPNHFNQSLLMRVDPGTAQDDLQAALRDTQRVHPALRSRFLDHGHGRRQTIQKDADIVLERHDLSALGSVNRLARLEEICNQVQRSLNIAAGRVFRAVLFRVGPDEARLLLVAHHLVVDAVSWRVILADVESAYARIQGGEQPALEPEPCGPATFQRLLAARLGAKDGVSHAAGSIFDPPQGHESDASRAIEVTATLSEAETRLLVTSAHRADRASVGDVLLAALARELCALTRRDIVLVDVEGHGRDILEDVDLSRSVGWLTTLSSVALPCAADKADSAELIRAAKDALRLAQPAASTPQATDVCFNYLGQIGETGQIAQVGDSGANFPTGLFRGIAPEPSGDTTAADLPRRYRLECNAAVIDGRLVTQYRFDAASLGERAATTLADNVQATVRVLIEHCAEAEADVFAGSADAAVFDAEYPLSPSQTGMWLQSVSQKAAHLFVEQAAFCLEGALDVAALTRALDVVIARHPALRSAIVYKGQQPVRGVLRQMPVRVHEEHASLDNEDAALSDLMARQRALEFQLERPPLIRFALLRMRSDRAWLVLSFHHIILDGWSLPILWAEAEAAYEAELNGRSAGLPAPPRDADFAAWLKARSPIASEAFWRARLAGFVAANPITAAVPDVVPDDAGEIGHFMTREAGAAIRSAAQACRVSPAAVIEVLWALLIAGRTQSSDIVFGATVSGRPPDVPGIERMVGFFINTVPIRIGLDDDDALRDAIAEHQRRRGEQAEFEHCSAGQIHGWSELPAHEPLFHSLLVFENLQTPGSDRRDRTGPASGEASASSGTQRVHGGRTAYPLTLFVSPGATPHVRFIYQPSCISAEAVRGLAGELERLVVQCPGGLDRTVRDWRSTIAFAPSAAPGLEIARPATPFLAPRSRVEYELTAIWERLFKRTGIGVLDDFFALGGHSLLALQMVAEVRTHLGIELPLHVLIADSTLEALARACGRQSAEDDALVPLTAGGPGMPVFCIHPLGGHVLCYAALGKRLAGTHPCWGLQAKGLRSGDRPADTWEEIVDHHWTLLQDAQRTGAGGRIDGIALVGYSYGGYIAMELAARARRLGARRVPVILLDVPHPSVVADGMLHPDAATLLHAMFGGVLDFELDQLRRMPEQSVLRHVFDRAIDRRVLPPGTSLEQLERVLHVAQAHSRLLPSPARYGFTISLLRARHGATRVSELPDLGWTPHVDGVSVTWVDGSHETMLEPQHVDGVARSIVDALVEPMSSV